MPFASFWPWNRRRDDGLLGRRQEANSTLDASKLKGAKSFRKLSRTGSESFVAVEKPVRFWSDRLPFRKSSLGGFLAHPNKMELEPETPKLEPLITQNEPEPNAYELPTKHPPSYDDLPLELGPDETAVSTSLPAGLESLKTTDPESSVTPTQIPGSPEMRPPVNFVTEQIPLAVTADDFSPSTPIEEVEPHNSQAQDAFAFRNEWMAISNRRINNLTRQAKIHEMRMILREKQNVKSALEDSLIQRIRMQEMGNPGSFDDRRNILDIVQEFQNVRDMYGPLEDECTELENQLAGEEFQLHRQEDEFYQKWDFVPISRHKSEEESEYERESSAAIQSSSDGGEFTYHPLVEKYLDKKGDLEILQEQLDDLKDERESIQDHMESRSIVGLSLAEEEQNWLDNSQKNESDLLSQIQTLEKEVKELQSVCFEMQLVDRDGDPTDWKGITGAGIPEMEPQPSLYSQFSTLLPEDTDPEKYEVQTQIRAQEPESIEEPSQRPPVPTALQLNIWLLRILQSSVLDVKQLAYFLARHNCRLTPKMQQLVLKKWFTDMENTPTKRGYQPSRSESMTTQAPRQPEFSEQLGLAPDSTSGKNFQDFPGWRRGSSNTDQTDIEDVMGVERLNFSP